MKKDARNADAQTLLADGQMTIDEARAFAKLGRSMLYMLMDSGKLPFVKIGRTRRIPKRALIDLMADGLVGAAQDSDR